MKKWKIHYDISSSQEKKIAEGQDGEQGSNEENDTSDTDNGNF